MLNYFWFLMAAIFEIAGCYCFWMWLRQDKSLIWVLPGVISLILFALILTKVETEFAGRAYAAYGGIYIISSLGWLAYIENEKLIRWDFIGALLCLAGATLIFLGPKMVNKFPI